MSKQKYLTHADFNAALPKEVSAHFKVVNMEKRTSLVVNFHKLGTVNFQSITLEIAEILIKKGVDFLERKAKTKSVD